jgi:hypothetical protein
MIGQLSGILVRVHCFFFLHLRNARIERLTDTIKQLQITVSCIDKQGKIRWGQFAMFADDLANFFEANNMYIVFENHV